MDTHNVAYLSKAGRQRPIRNPYDLFTAPQYDTYIDNITTAIKRALNPPREQVQQDASDAETHISEPFRVTPGKGKGRAEDEGPGVSALRDIQAKAHPPNGVQKHVVIVENREESENDDEEDGSDVDGVAYYDQEYSDEDEEADSQASNESFELSEEALREMWRRSGRQEDEDEEDEEGGDGPEDDEMNLFLHSGSSGAPSPHDASQFSQFLKSTKRARRPTDDEEVDQLSEDQDDQGQDDDEDKENMPYPHLNEEDQDKDEDEDEGEGEEDSQAGSYGSSEGDADGELEDLYPEDAPDEVFEREQEAKALEEDHEVIEIPSSPARMREREKAPVFSSPLPRPPAFSSASFLGPASSPVQEEVAHQLQGIQSHLKRLTQSPSPSPALSRAASLVGLQPTTPTPSHTTSRFFNSISAFDMDSIVEDEDDSDEELIKPLRPPTPEKEVAVIEGDEPDEIDQLEDGGESPVIQELDEWQGITSFEPQPDQSYPQVYGHDQNIHPLDALSQYSDTIEGAGGYYQVGDDSFVSAELSILGPESEEPSQDDIHPEGNDGEMDQESFKATFSSDSKPPQSPIVEPSLVEEIAPSELSLDNKEEEEEDPFQHMGNDSIGLPGAVPLSSPSSDQEEYEEGKPEEHMKENDGEIMEIDELPAAISETSSEKDGGVTDILHSLPADLISRAAPSLLNYVSLGDLPTPQAEEAADQLLDATADGPVAGEDEVGEASVEAAPAEDSTPMIDGENHDVSSVPIPPSENEAQHLVAHVVESNTESVEDHVTYRPGEVEQKDDALVKPSDLGAQVNGDMEDNVPESGGREPKSPGIEDQPIPISTSMVSVDQVDDSLVSPEVTPTVNDVPTIQVDGVESPSNDLDLPPEAAEPEEAPEEPVPAPSKKARGKRVRRLLDLDDGNGPARHTRSKDHGKPNSNASDSTGNSPASTSGSSQQNDWESASATSSVRGRGRGRPRRGRGRASSVASSVVSSVSSPTKRRVSVALLPPPPPPPIIHRHSHQHQTHHRRTSSVDTQRLALHPAAGSPATRSNCRFHKISIGEHHFVVPGCAISDKTLMKEEDIVDMGEASNEDNEMKTTDMTYLDEYVLGSLRKLVGVDLLHEQACGWLPKEGDIPPADSVPPSPKASHSRRNSKKLRYSDMHPPDADGANEPAASQESVDGEADADADVNAKEEEGSITAGRKINHKRKRSLRNSEAAAYKPATPDAESEEEDGADESHSGKKKAHRKTKPRQSEADVSTEVALGPETPQSLSPTSPPSTTGDHSEYEDLGEQSDSPDPEASQAAIDRHKRRKRRRNEDLLAYKPEPTTPTDDEESDDLPKKKRRRRTKGAAALKGSKSQITGPSGHKEGGEDEEEGGSEYEVEMGVEMDIDPVD